MPHTAGMSLLSSSCLRSTIKKTTVGLIGSVTTFVFIRSDSFAGHFMSVICAVIAYEYYYIIVPGFQDFEVIDPKRHVLKGENYLTNHEKFTYNLEPASVRRKRGPSKMFLVLSSFVMTYFAHYGNSKFYSTSLTMITSVVVSLHFIFRWNKGNASPTILDLFDLFIDVLGIFITWLMGHIILLRYYPIYGTAYVTIVFLVAWTADAGALVFGKLFGKYTPKLMPRTSPNKTVASLLGAIVVGVLTMTSLGFVLMQRGYFFRINFSLQPPPLSSYVPLVSIGFVLGISSVVGDTFESIIKRAARVRHSGATLPGYGGFLDYFNSVAACAVVMYYFIVPIFIPFWENYNFGLINRILYVWFGLRFEW